MGSNERSHESSERPPDVTLLHVSDLHIDAKSAPFIERTLDALATRAQSLQHRIDHVLISGDIAYRGTVDEYDLAKKVLGEFTAKLDLQANDVTVAPGNHDVNRRLIDEYQEAGYLHKLKDSQAANTLWRDAAQRERALERMSSFYDFARNAAYNWKPHCFAVGDVEVGICPLNSAWRCSSDSDKDHLFVATAQIDDGVKAIGETDIRVALMHHPFSWLDDNEQDDVLGRIAADFNVLLTGHRHSSNSASWTAPRESLLHIQAKAIHDPSRPVGASAIGIWRDGQHLRFRCTFWAYVRKHNTFAPDTEIADDGVHRGTLFLRANANAVRERSIVRTSTRKALETLVAGYRSLAPNLSDKLSAVPLTPVLSVGRKRNVPVSTLLAAERSTIVYGPPLSGKSTALLQLLRESRDQGLLALKLTLNTMTRPADVIGTCAKGAGIGRSDAQAVISSRPVLLVDDVDVSDSSHVEFLKNCAKQDIRFIAVARDERLNQVSARGQTAGADGRHQLKEFDHADLQPVPLTQIMAIYEAVELILPPGMRTGALRRLAAESFDAALPRQPWVVIVFFELIVSGRNVLGAFTLAQLLTRYTSHRLKIDASSAIGYDVSTRALTWIAAEMYARGSWTLPTVDAELVLRTELGKAALEPDAGQLQRLLSSGLLFAAAGGDEVGFTFPVFQDFFLALGYATQPSPAVKVDEGTLPAVGGALALLAAMRDYPELTQQVYDVTSKLRPSQSTTLSPNSIKPASSSIFAEVDGHDDVEKHAPTPDEYDDGHDRHTTAKIHRLRGPRRELGKLDRFWTSYCHSLSLLRNSTFLSKELKESRIRTCIENTVSFLNEMLSQKDAIASLVLERTKKKGLEDDPTVADDVDGVICALLTIFCGTTLAQQACAHHLEQPLLNVAGVLEDPSQRLIAIVWYAHISDARLEDIVDKYIESSPGSDFLKLLKMLLIVTYMNEFVLSGVGTAAMKSAIRALSVAVAADRVDGRRTARGVVTSAIAAREIAALDREALRVRAEYTELQGKLRAGKP